jgi:hypothetical protein
LKAVLASFPGFGRAQESRQSAEIGKTLEREILFFYFEANNPRAAPKLREWRQTFAGQPFPPMRSGGSYPLFLFRATVLPLRD